MQWTTWAAATSEPADDAGRFHFTATIESVEVLQKDRRYEGDRLVGFVVRYDGPIHLVDGALSNWAIRMRVDAIGAVNPCLAPGDTVVFGVHSPSRTLGMGGEAAVGQQFEFVATCGTSGDGEAKSIGLEPSWRYTPRPSRR